MSVEADSRDLMSEIGQRIRAFRKLRHVTQDQLGEAVGLSRVSISNIEGGKQGIQVETLAAIAERLGCHLTDLLPGLTPVPARYRVGRSLGRTIYRQVGATPSKADEFIGIMDTPELAQMVVAALNAGATDGT